MFTTRFTWKRISRRPSRRRVAARRRGWLVQRLEPRCVMAADALGIEADSLDSADFQPPEVTVPAHESGWASDVLDPPRPELPWLEPPQLEARQLNIDWLNLQTIEFTAGVQESITLSWDSAQLNSLLVDNAPVALHVVYDSARWEFGSEGAVICHEQENGEPGTLELPQLGQSLQLRSLVDQQATLDVQVYLGDPEQGASAQVVILLGEAMASPGEETLDQTFTGTMTDDPNQGHVRNTTLPATGMELPSLDDADTSNFEGDAPKTTVDLGTGDANPLDDSQASPLPELPRDASNKNARSPKRSLDIRSASSTGWGATSASKSPASPGSLATQAALTSVYEENGADSREASRWMLDPQPARLQVATFIISRTPRTELTTSTNAAKNVSTSAAAESAVSPTESVTQATKDTQESTPVSTSAGTVVRVTQLPDPGEVSSIRPSEAKIHPVSDDEDEGADAALEPTVYAQVLDRLLGSPISLVAILGLTVVLRSSDSEEAGLGP